MANERRRSPPYSGVLLVWVFIPMLLVFIATERCGVEFSSSKDHSDLRSHGLITQTVSRTPGFDPVIKGLTVGVAVLTAILFTVGYVYEWNFTLQLSLPPDLFMRPRDEILVKGAIVIASCFTTLRFAYLFPLLGFTSYLWGQWYFNRGLGILTLPINTIWFALAVWWLLRGVGQFPPYDLVDLAKHSQDQCFRLHKLHFYQVRRSNDEVKNSEPESPFECYLVRCTEKSIAVADRKTREIIIYRRDDISRIEVCGRELPAEPNGYFWRPAVKPDIFW